MSNQKVYATEITHNSGAVLCVLWTGADFESFSGAHAESFQSAIQEAEFGNSVLSLKDGASSAGKEYFGNLLGVGVGGCARIGKADFTKGRMSHESILIPGSVHDTALASVPVDGKSKTVTDFGLTADIIAEIEKAFFDSWGDVKGFANFLKGASRLETGRNVWQYLRQFIKYIEDPIGYQYIKDAGRIVYDGFSDCKGYAILANSILKNLGIPSLFRFVSYSDDPTPTHVFSVFPDENGNDVFLDACLPLYNVEKPYNYKVDKMTKIIRLSGVGRIGLVTTPFQIDPDANAGMLDLLLLRERLELEQQILGSKVSGVDESYAASLAVVNDALANFDNPSALAGIGASVGKTIFGKIIKKVADAGKKVGETVVKVATAPLRLAAKGIMEVTLPNAAPAFLYLFIPLDKLDSVPVKVREKRKKAEKRAKFITEVIGMKEEHFMGIVRNGIMKNTGKTPEQLINELIGSNKVSGIGVIPVNPVALSTTVSKIGIQNLAAIIEKITSLFKKKDDGGKIEEQVPSADDGWNSFVENEANKVIENGAGTSVITVTSKTETSNDPASNSTTAAGFKLNPMILISAAVVAAIALGKGKGGKRK